MEHIEILTQEEVDRPVIMPTEIVQTDSKRSSFIEANTIQGSLEEIKHNHIIPVFANNQTLISHADFIEETFSLVNDLFQGEQILKPEIRVSHPVMGRVPDAKDKSADQLQPWEKTLYYQKLAFVIEVPSIQSEVDGNMLSLTIGGVRNFSEENLYSRSVCDQRFRVFIGFKNTVCCNMCVFTDGYMGDLKVKNTGQLSACIRTLLTGYNGNYHLHHLTKLTEYNITEQQFAQVIGKCRMFQHLPVDEKKGITPLLLGDQQMTNVLRDYYRDDSFCRDSKGLINLWKVYNLLTSANKSSYIDSFLDRSVSSYNFVESLRWGLEGRSSNWYLN